MYCEAIIRVAFRIGELQAHWVASTWVSGFCRY